MEENTPYVLFDLESIKVNYRKINNIPIVFCESITVKLHETQDDITSIEDWSNIIIGDPQIYTNIGKDELVTIKISELTNTDDVYGVNVFKNIGLWSVILFETVEQNGNYTTLGNIIADSNGIGGPGTQGTNIKEVYENTLNTLDTYEDPVNIGVYNFLHDVLTKTKYKGCIFINNQNCGLFINISPTMFIAQKNLKNIVLTNTIIYISDTKGFGELGVFCECSNLESANIPLYLDNYFEYSIDDNEYNKPNILREVPSYYFFKCNKLENISIPDGIGNIGYAAFYGCDNVETINIPPSVISIGSASLVTVYRPNKRYINISGDNTKPTNIEFSEQSVGYDKLTDNNGNPTHNANDVIININDRDVVKLSGGLMYENSSFVKNTSNASEIYINCKTITGTVKNIQGKQKYDGGFVNTNFHTVYIGPDVGSICNFAFYNVKGTNLIINNGNVLATKYDDDREEGSINDIKDGDKYLVKTPFIRSNFANINILNCATVGVNALHSLNSSKLTFYEENIELPINNNLKVTNSTTLKTLSDRAFYNSTFSSIIIPSTVTKNDINCTNISNTAFLQTKGSLELNCDISGYKTKIDQNPRTGILINSGFRNINFNYAGSIPENILYENKSIKSIELGDKIKTISKNAFYLCTNLTGTLSLPTILSSIDETAFIGCAFSNFEADSSYFKTANNGMYLITGDRTGIVLFANKHSDIQITDYTFNINIDTTVNKICSYAFAYAFSDYGNSSVHAVNIPENIKIFGSNVFYNCYKLTRILFIGSNISDFADTELAGNILVNTGKDTYSKINTVGSFVDLPTLTEVYIGYTKDVLLSESFDNNPAASKNKWFLHNTLRKSYTNETAAVEGITIYVYTVLYEAYNTSAWKEAGYNIVALEKGDTPPPPGPPVENDDSYDADIDDPEGEEWPNDGGNGNISEEEDYIPPISENDTTTEGTDDSWITHENNVFKIPIKQLGTPSINVYGCRLDLLKPTYLDGHEPTNEDIEIIDQFGNIDFSALNYLKFNKVSDETHYGSDNDNMLKLYMGDYGNNFLIVFTVTGIDNFDATTNLFTSGVEYATHRESNWLKTEIVRIVKKPKEDANEDNIPEVNVVEDEVSENNIPEVNVTEDSVYYVVLLCTCQKLQNKDNYNCRRAIVSVNYGSQILDSSREQITKKIKVIQHKTELRLSNDTREINITDLDVLFCQETKHAEFIGHFFIGFPKNFWGVGDKISTDGIDSNKNKLREYINDYFRILYDKEKIKVIGQKTKIGDLDYTYIFDVADDKYANIKLEGSTTSKLMTFELCRKDYPGKLDEIHEEYYYVNFKIENLKTTLAGGVWNISIYNIGEPAEMLNIHVVEDQIDIPSIALYPTYAKITGNSWNGEEFSEHTISDGNLENNNITCSDIRSNNYVAAECQLPVSITNMPLGKNSNYIFPNIETTDICVDSSAVFTCADNNMVMSADEITNNFNYALTINIKNNTSGVSSFNMPISSKTLKKQSLSAIKYKKTELNINPSIYNYDANSNTTVNACLTSKPEKITIERIGDKQESDILSNTGAFLYKINTGLSVIADTYTNYLTRTDNTITYKPIIIGDGSTVLDTIIEASYINQENNLCIDHYNSFIIYDKYCNILAPIYPYYNELKYTLIKSETLQINKGIDSENVYISEDGKTTYYINNNSLATGQTYYCTATNDILIQADDTIDASIEGYDEHIKSRRYRGQAYKAFTTTSESPNIGVVKEVNSGINSVKYTEDCYGEHSYNDFSKATDVVTLKPIYDVKVNSKNVLHYSTQIGNDDLKNAPDNCKIHGKIIKVIEYVDVIYDEKEVGLCYEDGGKYYNFDDREINTEIDIKPRFTNIKYTYFIYLNPNYDNFTITDDIFYMPGSGRPCHVGGPYSGYPYINEDANEINTTRFYKIFNTDDIDNANGKYTNTNALINNIDNDIYADFKKSNMPTPTIEYDNYITESFNIADTHVNIYDIACNTNVYRQIFVNFSYNVNDNNVITKIYADNSNGLILQTRMLNNNINKPLVFNTQITLFGLDTTLSANNITFTGTIFKPQSPQVIKP